MNWRERDRIVEAMFKNEALYIRNTGVQVHVDYFGTDTRSNTGWNRTKTLDEYSKCVIEFATPPTLKALKLCRTFHIKRNSHSKTMELNGEIDIKNLSLTPYETKAAKVLYEKQKTKKAK